MYKKRFYLDTSVISYLYENGSPEKMRITLNLWDLFKRELYDIYISDIVIQEISKCNEKKLRILYNSLRPYREWAIMSVNGKRTCFGQASERRSQ